jgi:protein-disulfide isomerase
LLKKVFEVSKKMMVMAASLLALVAFVVAGFFYNQQKDQQAAQLAQDNQAVLQRTHAPVHGNPNAKVTIVEFFDPACETCAQFYPMVKSLISSHFGQIKLVMRYAPLHKGSDEVVKILEAARLQNLYWPVLEALFKSQSAWVVQHQAQPALVWDLIKHTGLDVAKAKADMNDPKVLSNVAQDLADMKAMGITMTPEYFVNGKPLTDFGWDQLKTLVDGQVRSAYAQ